MRSGDQYRLPKENTKGKKYQVSTLLGQCKGETKGIIGGDDMHLVGQAYCWGDDRSSFIHSNERMKNTKTATEVTPTNTTIPRSVFSSSVIVLKKKKF